MSRPLNEVTALSAALAREHSCGVSDGDVLCDEAPFGRVTAACAHGHVESCFMCTTHLMELGQGLSGCGLCANADIESGYVPHVCAFKVAEVTAAS